MASTNTENKAKSMGDSKAAAGSNPPEGKKNGSGIKNGVLTRIKQNRMVVVLLVLIAMGIVFGGAAYWLMSQQRVYIEKAVIDAPIISLGPAAPGVIDKFYVKEGERVHKNQVLAKVGEQYIRAQTDGIILSIKNSPGQLSNSQDAVVQMLDPREFRLVGRIEEDKGLSDIRAGQKVVFTVDAFGSKEYEGVVDSISPTARQSDIVFSISDKRQENEFEVKAKFDVGDYPELKNGMSAKMWVYKN